VARKLAVMIPWQFEMKREDAISLARMADAAGVHSFWVPEGWGRDAFSLLVSLAEKTEQIQLATGIVNVYSRTPGALAQHAATLDEWSSGRAILGLGASSANVIEQFHGIRFQPSLARVRETVAIVRTLLRGEPLVHHGKWFDMDRGFKLRMNPVRPEIPIFLATLNPNSVKMTAEIADGWIPAMVPHRAMAGEISQLRAWVREAGRDPAKVLVKAGNVTVSERPEAREFGRPFIAYYIARMGTFYYNQLVRFGFEEDAALVKRTFEEKGSAAAVAAIPERLVNELGFAGSAEACRDRILEQEKQGIDIHGISIEARDAHAFERAVDVLLR